MKTINSIKIKIEFEHISGNDNILSLIHQIGNSLKVRGVLLKENDRIKIYLDDELSKIENFSEELGKNLPFSIFMGTAQTTAVENIPFEIDDQFKLLSDINQLPQNLSICPSCMRELFDTKNRRFFYPFISCNYCGSHYSYLYEYPFQREKTVFKFFQPCESCNEEFHNPTSFRHKYELISCHSCLTPVYLRKGENERYGFDSEKTIGAMNTSAGIIQKGELLRVYTSQGEKIVGKVSEGNINKLREFLNLKRKPITLLITNPKILNEIAYISDAEIKALASQEKPVVLVQSKNFEGKDLISKLNFIKVKFPDEPLLILLADRLKEIGIDYIFIQDIKEDYHKEITDFELNADLPVINKQEDLELVVIQGKYLIKKGEKGIFPNIIKSKKTGNLSIANDYAVLDLGEGEYLIDKKEKILFQLPQFVDKIESVNILNGEFEDIKVPYKNKKSFTNYEGAILSVLGEYNKIEEPSVGIYFSYTENNDVIALKSSLKPLKPLIWIKPVKLFNDFNKTVKWALDQIEDSSEEGERLLNNFKAKFPEIYNRFQNVSLEESGKSVSSITAVLNIASILLGSYPYDEVSYFEEPYLYLQDESFDFVGNQGLMIDFFLEEENGIFYLNWIKMLQSILAYKLADVENKMIAFSIFEGLGDWIVKETERVSQKMKIKNVALSGDFFSNQVLTGRIVKHFSGKYNILLNRKMPIDKQNIAFGGIFV